MPPALIIAIAYLSGSIPFGYVIVRAMRGTDIRETGSGGTGATNVSRRAGKGAGILTLVLDALKGAVAVVIAKWALDSSANGLPAIGWGVAAAAIAVIIGHMFPVWLKFKGGKGVATGVGVFLILSPLSIAAAAAIFLLIVWRTRYVSLGSIVAAVAIPILVLLQQTFIRPIYPLAPTLVAAIAVAALIVLAHRANIGRLLAGTESRFS